MSKTVAPQTWIHQIVEVFSDTASPAYGQAGTVDSEGNPTVRTVHFKFVPEEETIGFAACITSAKWTHLSRKPKLAGCFYDQRRRIQFRWDSEARLFTAQSNEKSQLLKRMWSDVRKTVREVYWEEFLEETQKEKRFNPEEICPDFGIVLLTPTFWDIYELVSDDYRTHRRSQHHLEGGEWNSNSVSVLGTRI